MEEYKAIQSATDKKANEVLDLIREKKYEEAWNAFCDPYNAFPRIVWNTLLKHKEVQQMPVEYFNRFKPLPK